MQTQSKTDIFVMAEILMRLGFTISIVDGKLFVETLPQKE